MIQLIILFSTQWLIEINYLTLAHMHILLHLLQYFTLLNHSQLSMNILDAISVTTQSIPSISPSPVTAEQGIIPQCLVDMSSNARNSLIS